MKAMEKLESLEAKTPVKPKSPGMERVFLWKKWMMESTGKSLPILSSREAGQLKHIYNKLEQAGQDARIVLQVVIANWDKFVACVCSVDLRAGEPTEPSIGYVLKHIQILIDYPPNPADGPSCAPDPTGGTTSL